MTVVRRSDPPMLRLALLSTLLAARARAGLETQSPDDWANMVVPECKTCHALVWASFSWLRNADWATGALYTKCPRPEGGGGLIVSDAGCRAGWDEAAAMAAVSAAVLCDAKKLNIFDAAPPAMIPA